MTFDLDALIEDAAVYGARAGGMASQFLSVQADPRRVAVLGARQGATTAKAAYWAAEDDAFLREHLGWLSEEEIGARLGRTRDAIHLRWTRDLRLTAPTKNPDWLPAIQVADLLGQKCAKSIVRLIQEGLLSARMAPTDTDIYLIHREEIKRFAVNPENWIYFRPERVTDPYLRSLISRRKERWGDEWWSVGQVTAYHGLSVNAVNQQIRKGLLRAKRWGNWWVRRSDALAAKFQLKKGHPIEWSEGADAFLLLGHAVGLSNAAVEHLCGWPHARASYRLKILRSCRRIEPIIAAHKLPIQIHPESGLLWADWWSVRHRFPSLYWSIQRYVHEDRPTTEDVRAVATVLAVWARFYAPSIESRKMAERWWGLSNVSVSGLKRMEQIVYEWDLDPLRRDHATGALRRG